MKKKKHNVICDTCIALGVDTKILNGEDSKQKTATLYRVLKDKTIDIKLCQFHDIELFKLGEKKFLKQNIEYTLYLRNRYRKPVEF